MKMRMSNFKSDGQEKQPGLGYKKYSFAVVDVKSSTGTLNRPGVRYAEEMIPQAESISDTYLSGSISATCFLRRMLPVK